MLCLRGPLALNVLYVRYVHAEKIFEADGADDGCAAPPLLGHKTRFLRDIKRFVYNMTVLVLWTRARVEFEDTLAVGGYFLYVVCCVAVCLCYFVRIEKFTLSLVRLQ